MPAKPSYCHRLPEGIAALEALTAEWVGRRDLEEALGVSKTVAWRILRKCRATAGPGGSLMCPRGELISRLRKLQADGAIHEQEIERRGRLDRFLTSIRPDVVANLTKVAHGECALELVSMRFRKLPANITLSPVSLHIEFFGTEEFLKAMGAVVFALHNDYEEISAFIEAAPDGGNPRLVV